MSKLDDGAGKINDLSHHAFVKMEIEAGSKPNHNTTSVQHSNRPHHGRAQASLKGWESKFYIFTPKDDATDGTYSEMLMQKVFAKSKIPENSILMRLRIKEAAISPKASAIILEKGGTNLDTSVGKDKVLAKKFQTDDKWGSWDAVSKFAVPALDLVDSFVSDERKDKTEDLADKHVVRGKAVTTNLGTCGGTPVYRLKIVVS